jgi:FkbM family methyltransferase
MSAKQLVFQAINAMSHVVSPDIVARVAKVMYFKEVFDRYGIDLVLDVGANGGQYARVLREYGFTGDIVSFEPVSSEFAKLATAAKGDARWTVLNYALGSNEAEQTINIMASSVFSSFNTPSSESTSTFAHENKVIGTEVVKVRRLDNVLTELGLRDRLSHCLLKCDTQGFDLKVLEGASALVNEVQLLQIEISVSKIYENTPPMTEMLGFVGERGFAPVAFFPVNRLPDSSALEFDYLGVNRRLVKSA